MSNKNEQFNREINETVKSKTFYCRVEIGNFDLCLIRRKIHDFHTIKKELITLKKLHACLKQDIQFY